MNIQLEFSGFSITELVYRVVANISGTSETFSEEVEQKAQGKLAIHKELEVCIFEYEIDLKTFVNSAEFRTLELSVQFHYTLNFENEEVKTSQDKDKIIKKIRSKFTGDMLSFIKFEIKEIVRRITSIDHLPSIGNIEEISFVIEV